MYVCTFHIGQVISDAVCCLLGISSGGLGIGRDVVGLWNVGALCSFVLDKVCFHQIFLFRRYPGIVQGGRKQWGSSMEDTLPLGSIPQFSVSQI